MRNSFIVLERAADKKGAIKVNADGSITFKHHANKLFQESDGSPRHFANELEILTAIEDARSTNVDIALLKKANQLAQAGENEKALALISAAQGELTGEVIILNVIDL